ncbi:acyl-CoA dehydrogenase family protein [Sphingopyxis macrogoltabida]|uniref:Dibenzothiophene monooxygenase n=1 Tax=Sphingopyxis macrogoltabida TaxID=33050 RepID=A0A0N7GSJ2_SPHMC|nr:acyl-CoA dehydrogenase family protein [Sphingopyxis macrogoltabida]ALH80867.1 acyl-CoA dehydrogenase [Sphingopyxis macrogoltabida]
MLIATKTKTMQDWLDIADRIGEQIGARAAAHDREGRFVAENFALLREAGLIGAAVPVDLGGDGLDYRTLCAIVRRIGTRCGSTALAFSMHCHLVAAAVWRWERQQAPTDGLLRRVAAENLVLVSSGGSDWLQSAGTATRVDGGFRIDARKIFSSGSPAGDLLMSSAVYDDPEAGPTVLHFALPFAAEGVTVLDTWDAMGMRGTGSHDVEIKGAFLADAAVSGRRPQGKWHPLFHIISMIAFPLIYSAYVGVAEAARDAALAVARRKPANAGLIALAGEMQNSLWTAETALDAMIAAAETAEPGPATTSYVMTGRTVVGRAATRTVELAMELAGGGAFYKSSPIERAFRDIQGARFHPLQEPAQRDLSGRLALELDIDG